MFNPVQNQRTRFPIFNGELETRERMLFQQEILRKNEMLENERNFNFNIVKRDQSRMNQNRINAFENPLEREMENFSLLNRANNMNPLNNFSKSRRK